MANYRIPNSCLTDEEYCQILRKMRELDSSDRSWQIYTLAFRAYLATGARRSEILGLRWIHLNLDAPSPYALITGKGNKKRHVHFKLWFVPRLRAWKRKHMKAGGDYVFVRGVKRLRISPRDINRKWEEFRDLCGLRKLRIHDLRHTFGSYDVCLGLDHYQRVSIQLGHTNPTFTHQRYVQAVPGYFYGGRPRFMDELDMEQQMFSEHKQPNSRSRPTFDVDAMIIPKDYGST